MKNKENYRPNVAIIIVNRKGKILWCKRKDGNGWQFPQGGIQFGETPEQALYRELREEVGLLPEHVQIIAQTKGWLRYRLPHRYIRSDSDPVCIGQKQKWFLLKLTASPHHIQLNLSDPPEFDEWQWVSYWYPVSKIVDFKKEVYRSALAQLAPYAISQLTLELL